MASDLDTAFEDLVNKPKEPSFQIMVFGDFAVDEYLFGDVKEDRFTIKEHKRFAGCAGNVVENLAALADPDILVTNLCDYSNGLMLTRLMDQETGLKIIEHWNRQVTDLEGYNNLGAYTILDVAAMNKKPHTGVVLSDYNKGALQNLKLGKQPFACDWIIVDSRYRTLDKTWLNYSNLNIWHATGQEYDKDWADPFDYIIRTNGPGKVQILVGGAQDTTVAPADTVLAEFEVPIETEVIDTCGAGDTFVATLAMYLAKHKAYRFSKAPLEKLLCLAVEEAIASSQTVVSKPLTSITTYKLKD